MEAVNKNHWHEGTGLVLRSGMILFLTLACSLGQETRQLLLKHKPGLQAAGSHAAAHYGKAYQYRFIPWSLVEMPAEDCAEAKTACERSGLYDVVMEPKIYQISRIPDDPLYSQLWGMAKIQAPLGWDLFALNPSIVVAVIDTGIDFSHPDLAPNLWTGPQGEHGYTCTNGLVVIGGSDDHYHGTHVAGTIGAAGNNGLGVVGINWSIQMISLKFIRASGSGSSANAALLIERMIDLIQAGVPIRVSNNSWGGAGADPFLEDAFRAAEDAGVLNICAAGNNGVDLSDLPHSPASFALDGIISVLASDQQDNKSDFSNYGADADLAAPGVSILSCKPGGGYQFLSGTSMASPHVAGAAAALFALNPSLSVLQARNILLDPASLDLTPFPFSSTGGGRLNMAKALTNPLLNQPSTLTNRPPVLVLSPTNDFILPPGQTLTVTASVSDPNGDETQLISSLSSEQDYTQGGLLQEMIGWHYRTNSLVQSIDVYGAPLAIDLAPKFSFFATDGHGGAASKTLRGFVPRRTGDHPRPFQGHSIVYGQL
jgi:subtilisin family serine protease